MQLRAGATGCAPTATAIERAPNGRTAVRPYDVDSAQRYAISHVTSPCRSAACVLRCEDGVLALRCGDRRVVAVAGVDGRRFVERQQLLLDRSDHLQQVGGLVGAARARRGRACRRRSAPGPSAVSTSRQMLPGVWPGVWMISTRVSPIGISSPSPSVSKTLSLYGARSASWQNTGAPSFFFTRSMFAQWSPWRCVTMIICTSVPFAAAIAFSLSSGASTKIDCFVAGVDDDVGVVRVRPERPDLDHVCWHGAPPVVCSS